MHEKSLTPVDEDYICTLSADTIAFSADDLRESAEIRENALREIREWAMNNPKIIKLRLDSNFLLRFLRCRKFSIPMTKEIIERYLVLRHLRDDGVKIFTNLDYRLPVMQELLNLG
jgi:tRNA splicing endonuclease